MSKLVEGIKDRMVAAAREAAPAVVRQLPMPRTWQGRRPSSPSPPPPLSP